MPILDVPQETQDIWSNLRETMLGSPTGALGALSEMVFPSRVEDAYQSSLPMAYILKTRALPFENAMAVDWLKAEGGVDFKRALQDLVGQMRGTYPPLNEIWAEPIRSNMEGGGRAMGDLVRHLPGIRDIAEHGGEFSKAIPLDVLEELLTSKRQQKQFFDAVRNEPKWSKR